MGRVGPAGGSNICGRVFLLHRKHELAFANCGRNSNRGVLHLRDVTSILMELWLRKVQTTASISPSKCAKHNYKCKKSPFILFTVIVRYENQENVKLGTHCSEIER
jgi:hypothetical protein